MNMAEAIDGEVFRYFVRSARCQHTQYLVDLESYGFSGECNCEDFVFKRRKHAARGARGRTGR